MKNFFKFFNLYMKEVLFFKFENRGFFKFENSFKKLFDIINVLKLKRLSY